jgi:hypothetical protein
MNNIRMTPSLRRANWALVAVALISAPAIARIPDLTEQLLVAVPLLAALVTVLAVEVIARINTEQANLEHNVVIVR